MPHTHSAQYFKRPNKACGSLSETKYANHSMIIFQYKIYKTALSKNHTLKNSYTRRIILLLQKSTYISTLSLHTRITDLANSFSWLRWDL